MNAIATALQRTFEWLARVAESLEWPQEDAASASRPDSRDPERHLEHVRQRMLGRYY
jgi:hypothetical protein